MLRKCLFFMLLLIGIVYFLCGLTFQDRSLRKVSQNEEQELMQYLKTYWKTPEEYVVSKFQDYDIVFIGEAHHIKHDVEFIHNLIPLLYKIGVYNLGIEFGCYEYQDKVDALTTGETYDEDLARWLMFKWGSYWPYKEYIDIYKKVWELNKSLPHGKPKFRVVNLDYRVNWNLNRERVPPELWDRIYHKGERDTHMSRVIFKEFVKKNKKALIYAGQHHAITHYYQPDYDFENKKLRGLKKNRMGNLVYHKVPDKVFNICLHYPWQTRGNKEKHNYPVDGIIDKIMSEFEDKRVGFDVINSPFGKLRDYDTYYSAGYDDFTLSTFCDGYIFQKHLKDYKSCTVDPLFVTKENFKEAINYLPTPGIKKKLKTPQQYLDYMKRSANIKRRFGDLK